MVTELFVSAALATVPPVNLLPSREETVVSSVPDAAGRESVTVPVVAVAAILVVPEEFTKPNCASPANVVTVAPNETAVLPMVTELFVSAALATVPAVKLPPARAEAELNSVPVFIGNVSVFDPEAPGIMEVVPELELLKEIFVIPEIEALRFT